MEEGKVTYTIIFDNVMRDDNLSSLEKLVYSRLLGLSQNDENMAFCSNKYLGEIFNKSEKSISNCISSLKKKEYIKNVKVERYSDGLNFKTRREMTVNYPYTQKMDNPPKTGSAVSTKTGFTVSTKHGVENKVFKENKEVIDKATENQIMYIKNLERDLGKKTDYNRLKELTKLEAMTAIDVLKEEIKKLEDDKKPKPYVLKEGDY